MKIISFGNNTQLVPSIVFDIICHPYSTVMLKILLARLLSDDTIKSSKYCVHLTHYDGNSRQNNLATAIQKRKSEILYDLIYPLIPYLLTKRKKNLFIPMISNRVL